MFREIMRSEEKQKLAYIARTAEHKYFRVETIRRLAGTEEEYRIIMREIDRIKAQLMRARTAGVAATLDIVEWFLILESFNWKCAYCQKKPFQVMSHKIPQAEGGTTSQNCVPACYSCIVKHRSSTSIDEETLSLQR